MQVAQLACKNMLLQLVEQFWVARLHRMHLCCHMCRMTKKVLVLALGNPEPSFMDPQGFESKVAGALIREDVLSNGRGLDKIGRSADSTSSESVRSMQCRRRRRRRRYGGRRRRG